MKSSTVIQTANTNVTHAHVELQVFFDGSWFKKDRDCRLFSVINSITELECAFLRFYSFGFCIRLTEIMVVVVNNLNVRKRFCGIFRQE
jgi:hypothetical protein